MSLSSWIPGDLENKRPSSRRKKPCRILSQSTTECWEPGERVGWWGRPQAPPWPSSSPFLLPELGGKGGKRRKEKEGSKGACWRCWEHPRCVLPAKATLLGPPLGCNRLFLVVQGCKPQLSTQTLAHGRSTHMVSDAGGVQPRHVPLCPPLLEQQGGGPDPHGERGGEAQTLVPLQPQF